jgi:uncharacterized protein
VKPPDAPILQAAVCLGRALRERGVRASMDREMVFCQALAELDPRLRSHVYWAAHAAFLQTPEEQTVFDAVFERFWAGQSLERTAGRAEHGESDPRMTGPQHGGESMPQFRHEGRPASLVDGGASRATREFPSSPDEEQGAGERRGVLAAYSPAESASNVAALDYRPDELAAVRRLADDLRRSVPERRSRRLRPSRCGERLDLRRTLKAALATDGEAFRLAYAGPTPRPRRLLFICDVSGSMERYSRVLLASLKAAVGSGANAEAFVFATRLTRLTSSLSGRDVDLALEVARARVADWSGGTRIGAVLAGFNRDFGRRGFARGAIVVVVSDGWDRGDPDVLARELRRLQLQARRLVWINPRPVALHEQPLATGMRAAMPYVDDFVPGHDPRAMAGLASIVSGVGAHRPRRRARVLDSALS